MTITRVESIAFGVDDMEAAVRFFCDWGLACTARGAQGADFELPTGQSLHVRMAADASLPAAMEPAPTAREIVWGVDSEGALAALGAELEKDRPVARGADGVLRTRDPCGVALGFRIMRPRRAGGRVADGSPVGGHRIAHVVYSITRQRASDMAAFYLERLQFRLSDRVRDNGDFMRAPGADDHHNLFLQHRPDRLAYNHVAFELASYDEVLKGGQYMESRGWKTIMGPGGHYLSSHKFWYFKSPCGGDAEYFFGATRFDDTWQTRYWDTAPRTGPSGA